MKKFKGMLLACDMDGTLLDDSKQIPAENLRALQYFTKQGGRLSLATGRSPHAIGTYIDQLPVNAPYSVMNGSLICDENRKILYCSGMPCETKEMIEHVLLNNSQFGCEVFTAETALIRQMSDHTLQHMHKLHLDYQMLSNERFAKSATADWCTVNFTGEPAQITALTQDLLIRYPHVFDVTSSMSTFCEITAAGVNKGSALRNIVEYLPDVERVFAIGDSYNDESMLQEAQISFAPANAEPEVLQNVNMTVSSNNDRAVADMIEYLEKIG